MVKKQKRYWAHKYTVQEIFGLYIALIFVALGFALAFHCLANSKEIDAGVEGAIRNSILSGLKSYGIAMAVITYLSFLWFILRSDRVELTETSIVYYRTVFTKTPRIIDYTKVTKCVYNGGLWCRRGKYVYKKNIILYYKDAIIIEFELNYRLCAALFLCLGKRVWLVDDNNHLRSIDHYYKIDFASLTDEQRLAILKQYCKLNRPKYKTGEQIIKKLK